MLIFQMMFIIYLFSYEEVEGNLEVTEFMVVLIDVVVEVVTVMEVI